MQNTYREKWPTKWPYFGKKTGRLWALWDLYTVAHPKASKIKRSKTAIFIKIQNSKIAVFDYLIFDPIQALDWPLAGQWAQGWSLRGGPQGKEKTSRSLWIALAGITTLRSACRPFQRAHDGWTCCWDPNCRTPWQHFNVNCPRAICNHQCVVLPGVFPKLETHHDVVGLKGDDA